MLCGWMRINPKSPGMPGAWRCPAVRGRRRGGPERVAGDHVYGEFGK